MTNQPVLRSRTTPATAPVPASEADAQLSVELRLAQTLAKGGEAVPKSYRGNVAAVWLAIEWANRRDMDVMTAMQSVSFFQGKPLVDATMQRSLAEQAGYRVEVEGDDQSATVTVVKPGDTKQHSATFTIEEAKTAGLLSKDVWKAYPADMLVARATTRALRRHASKVVSGLRDPDEAMDVDTSDPIAALTKNAGEDQDPETVDVAHNPVGESEEPSVAKAAPESSPADIEDAEIVDDQPITDPTRGKVLDAMREAKKRDDWGQVAQEMQGEGIQMVASKMTEAEGQLVLGILGSGE